MRQKEAGGYLLPALERGCKTLGHDVLAEASAKAGGTSPLCCGLDGGIFSYAIFLVFCNKFKRPAREAEVRSSLILKIPG